MNEIYTYEKVYHTFTLHFSVSGLFLRHPSSRQNTQSVIFLFCVVWCVPSCPPLFHPFVSYVYFLCSLYFDLRIFIFMCNENHLQERTISLQSNFYFYFLFQRRIITVSLLECYYFGSASLWICVAKVIWTKCLKNRYYITSIKLNLGIIIFLKCVILVSSWNKLMKKGCIMVWEQKRIPKQTKDWRVIGKGRLSGWLLATIVI